MEKLVRKVQFIFTETDELRKIYVRDLEGIPDLAVKAMESNKMFTVGDVLDRWTELGNVKGIGVVRVRHVRAAIFAQICEMGLLKNADLVERFE